MNNDEQTNATDTTGDKDNSVNKEAPEEEGLSIVEEAQKVRDEIKSENDRREEILRKEQQLQAQKMLGGKSEAGQVPQKKEETDAEYTKRIEKEVYEGKYD